MTASEPMLSVIVPVLNEADTLPHLLGDLRRQEGITLEILVADGGSSDATRQVAQAQGARVVEARQGRGAQMNAAASQAHGPVLLFLHADSRLCDPHLLRDALLALRRALQETSRVAGHFPLRFQRTRPGHGLAYRFLEAKSALNRVNTTNGDQGLLLSRRFFDQLGGFDESLPFLEDQRLAEKIRVQGRWITLPGAVLTSARRFESEGFHRRYLLMGLMMLFFSINETQFFHRAPEVYRAQGETGRLRLSPFFALIRSMIRRDWGLRGTLHLMLRSGRYLRQNTWQPFFFLDVCLRPLLGDHRAPLLWLHDRIIAPCLRFGVVDGLIGLLLLVGGGAIVAPAVFLWESAIETAERKTRP
jgi:rSAM/selenodomain-associated transferase 2